MVVTGTVGNLESNPVESITETTGLSLVPNDKGSVVESFIYQLFLGFLNQEPKTAGTVKSRM